MFEMVKGALSFLNTDTCTITNKVTVQDGNFSKQKDEIIVENQPCRLSFKTIVNPNVQDGDINKVIQDTTLFLAPEIEVNTGSKITVFRGNKELHYKRSGEPKLYSSHQEISLEIDKDYA